MLQLLLRSRISCDVRFQAFRLVAADGSIEKFTIPNSSLNIQQLQIELNAVALKDNHLEPSKPEPSSANRRRCHQQPVNRL